MIYVSVQIENSAEEFALYIVHTSGGESAKKTCPPPPRRSRRVGRGKAPSSARPNAGAFGVAEKQKLRASDYPLIARILQGPCEQVSKVFLMEKDQVEEVTYDVSLPARDARHAFGWARDAAGAGKPAGRFGAGDAGIALLCSRVSP